MPRAHHADMDPEEAAFYATLGARVAQLRRLRRWTQADLAERAQCSRQNLNNIERGHQGMRPIMFARLAAALGADVDQLIVAVPEQTAIDAARAQIVTDLERLPARQREELDQLHAKHEQATLAVVRRAREANMTWAQVGHALGVSAQVARKRYATLLSP